MLSENHNALRKDLAQGLDINWTNTKTYTTPDVAGWIRSMLKSFNFARK